MARPSTLDPDEGAGTFGMLVSPFGHRERRVRISNESGSRKDRLEFRLTSAISVDPTFKMLERCEHVGFQASGRKPFFIQEV
jgi:hypothetical protein